MLKQVQHDSELNTAEIRHVFKHTVSTTKLLLSIANITFVQSTIKFLGGWQSWSPLDIQQFFIIIILDKNGAGIKAEQNKEVKMTHIGKCLVVIGIIATTLWGGVYG